LQTSIFIPENAPFNPDQRLWLNGYMAGLLAGKNLALEKPSQIETAASATIPLLILFGSQTGTAEKLARQIAKESQRSGYRPQVLEAAQYAKIDWRKESNLLVVTSTYGDGEMPDNAQPFWEWLQTESANALAHMQFSVLALGDTNYEQFCAAGIKIDSRLAQIGAKRLQPLVMCDVDYEAKAQAWTTDALAAFAPGKIASGVVPKPLHSSSEFSKSHPFPAQLLSNRRLNAASSEKETRHFEISLGGSQLAYAAGDALGIYPRNCPKLVDDILLALHFNGEETVKLSEGEMALRPALLQHLDINKPSAEMLRHFAVNHNRWRDLSSLENDAEFKTWLAGRQLIDLLSEPANVKISPAEFVTLLKKLAPRLYSISSSPKAHAGQVHLTINVIRHEAHGRERKGVGSTFLADRAGEAPVPIFVHASPGFRLPADEQAPVIMVGPGTGIAPFRAFLHERRAVNAQGRNWLFFGEQRAATDFYYRDELEAMFSDGHLTKLSTAFSRDQANKIYVQHRMREQAAELWAWLQDGAYFYVCGDAARMAKDVDAALHQVIQTAGGKSADEAKSYVAKLKTEKRYLRDVY
jgi:sulfite reductase (NADPH) flavoprotein alpha-component